MSAPRSPLVLSATRTSWSAPLQHGSKWDRSRSVQKKREEILRRDGFSCQSCGWVDREFLEIHHIDSDHANFRDRNLEAICPLCHQVHHPATTSMSGGGALVWLPEMSQVDLNRLCFTLITLDRAGPKHPWHGLAKAVSGLLDVRKVFFESQIGRSDPALMGQILLNMPPHQYAARAETLSAIKLLPAAARFETEADYWLAQLTEKNPPDSLLKWADSLR